MYKDNSFTFWHLLWRSLLPSATSIIIESVAALFLIGLHMVLMSVNAGVILPRLFSTLGGGWSTSQSPQIITPLNNVIHSQYLNTAFIICLWGLAGWIVYEITFMIVSASRSVHESQNSVYVPREALVVHHPLRRLLVAKFAWRLSILVIALFMASAIQPLLRHIWLWDEAIAQTVSLAELLKLLSYAFLSWVAIFHIFVVLLRLFLFRTRVFGEVIQ